MSKNGCSGSSTYTDISVLPSASRRRTYTHTIQLAKGVSRCPGSLRRKALHVHHLAIRRRSLPSAPREASCERESSLDIVSNLIRMNAAEHKDLLDLAQTKRLQCPSEERCSTQRKENTRCIYTQDFEAAIIRVGQDHSL